MTLRGVWIGMLAPVMALELLGDWSDVANRDTQWGAAPTASGEYEIDTPQALAQFAWQVNAGRHFAGEVVSVTAPIDLTAELWVPAGSVAQPFRGRFIGRAPISNMCVDSQASHAGFFGYVGSGGVLEGVVLTGIDVRHSFRRGCYVGGVVGELCDGLLLDCSASGSVVSQSMNGSGDQHVRVGGIAGLVWSHYPNFNAPQLLVNRCMNHCAVQATLTGSAGNVYAGASPGAAMPASCSTAPIQAV